MKPEEVQQSAKALSPEQAFSLLEKVRENAAKLRACPAHSFGIVLTGHIREKHTCRNCGGEMDERSIMLYARGYAAAGRDPNDVGRFIDKDNPGVGIRIC